MSISKYIKFKKSVYAINDKYGIEPIHVKILDHIANANYENHPISVSDLIAIREIASPATIHMRLKQLVSLGMLEMKPCPDHRKKFLTVTNKTHERMNEICELINQQLD